MVIGKDLEKEIGMASETLVELAFRLLKQLLSFRRTGIETIKL